jgi:hypothetical protein
MARPKLPLSNQRDVKFALRDLHDLLPELDKLEDCGVECKQHRELAEKYRRQLEAIRTGYCDGDK